jgi:excisionase family DNA binding protein
MKKQWLVNKYHRGQARVSDRDNLDDDAERKKFDAWWKSSADKYEEKNLNAHNDFKAFYAGNDSDDSAKGKVYDQLELIPATEAQQGDEDAPGIDGQTIEKIAEGLKLAGYELRKIGEDKPEATNAPKSWDDLPVILTPEEVQAVLRISRPTFFRMVKEGKLAGATKQGGSWLIDRDTLKASTQKNVDV